jgi:predicted membrane-bound spermidine synthase
MFYLFVFFGGFTSLVYQVNWQRLAAFSLGSDAGAASIVAAAFMTGLGFGSLYGAMFSKNLSQRRCIIALLLLELSIGVLGLASLPILYQYFYLQVSGHIPFHLLGPIVFTVLTLPAFLMGASFPLVTKVAVNERDNAPAKITNLFGVNTFGAALGALIGGLVLMRHFGIEAATCIAAAVNLIAGLTILPCLKTPNQIESNQPAKAESEKQSKQTATHTSPPESPSAANTPFRAWCLLYSLSGFVNLGLELVWFRLLGITLKANTFSFSWLLFFYLSGLAAGSLFAAKKLKHATGQTFLLLQLALTAYTVIFQIVLFREAQVGGILAWLHDYFGSYNPLDLSSYSVGVLFSPEGELFRALYLGLALLMVFPPTFMMGVSFYCLQNSVQNEISLVSRKVGILQMCNILGGTLALLLLGLFGLKYLGTFNALMVICAINQIFLPVFFYIEYKNNETNEMKERCIKRCLLFAALSILPCMAMPNAHAMWSVLHGGKPDFAYEEDHTGIASVQTAYDDKYFVFVNGEGHSEIPFGSYHSQVGLVPLFLHDNPEDIAIIGLGSGDTCYSASSHKNTKSITCIEIIEAEPRVLKKHAEKTNYEPLKMLFSDPRIKFVSGDGRRYIESCGQKFDIIQADALRPFTSRAGMLYSKEYFQAMKASLKPGGLLVTWLPTKRTYDTFRSVFPEHLNFGNTAIGSNQPIILDTVKALERYQQFCLSDRVKATGHDGEKLVSQFLSTVLPNDHSAVNHNNNNQDLFPRDEFLLPQLKN